MRQCFAEAGRRGAVPSWLALGKSNQNNALYPLRTLAGDVIIPVQYGAPAPPGSDHWTGSTESGRSSSSENSLPECTSGGGRILFMRYEQQRRSGSITAAAPGEKVREVLEGTDGLGTAH